MAQLSERVSAIQASPGRKEVTVRLGPPALIKWVPRQHIPPRGGSMNSTVSGLDNPKMVENVMQKQSESNGTSKIGQFFTGWKAFPEWKLKLVIFLYFLLLTFAILVPIITAVVGGDVQWAESLERKGLSLAIVGMVGVLLAPFVKLIQDASEARELTFGIHKAFSEFDVRGVSVKPRQGLNDLVAAVHRYHAPLIFLGFKDKEVLLTLLNELKKKERGALYINPRVLTSLIEMVDAGGNLPSGMVYVTDCPRESCTVFGSDPDGKMNGIIFRYLPRRTISRKDECWWSATLRAESSYPDFLYNTYERHYRREAATLITSHLKIRLLNEVNQRRTAQNRELIANHLAVLTRPLAYKYAANVLRHAQTSIVSVDIMSPKLWARTGGFIYDYIQSHKRDESSDVQKIRIHGYDEEHFKADADEYKKFIQMQREINVRLFFVARRLVRQTGIERGFVIVDDEMVFLAEDLASVENQNGFTLDDLENVQDLLESGFFDFTKEGLAKHKELFERLRHKPLLSAEEFEAKLDTGVAVSGRGTSSAEAA